MDFAFHIILGVFSLSLIDVIIPVFNEKKRLVRLLRSLNDQELDKELFTVIIVDDGSKDPVPDMREMFPKLNLTQKRHPKNLGLPSALNTALNLGSSRYFVRVDADDFVHSRFLDVLLLAHQNKPDAVAMAVDYKRVDEFENVLSYHSAEAEPIGCGIMFRRDILDSIGVYDENMLIAEDYEFMLRLRKKYDVVYIGICLYRYTLAENSLSSKKEAHLEYIKTANHKHGIIDD